MSLIDFLVISLTFGIEAMVAMRSCVEQTPIRLTKGVLNSFIMAVVFVLLMNLGIFVSNFLRFNMPEVDVMVCFGIFVMVIVKLLFGVRKGRAFPAFDMTRLVTVISMSVALGINTLLIGLGIGFVSDFTDSLWKLSIPLLIIVFLLALLGVMFGRRKVEIKQRRWQLFALLFLVVIAVKVAFF